MPGELFTVEGNAAFLIRPAPDKVQTNSTIPWVWYAPTYINLPEERECWMIERFLAAGIAVAGVDVGVSHGSPKGRTGFSAFYKHMVEQRGFSRKPALLCRSQGGLMHYNWAAEHPESVGCIAGIYPVGDLRSWPGLKGATGVYGMTEAQLEAQLAEHNPVDRLAPLAKAKVPIFHIHGDVDKLVPLDANSGTVASRYKELGGPMTLQIAKGQGHNYWSGFFECRELVDFVISHIATKAPTAPSAQLPKVLMIGDSISGGYGAEVIRLLEGKAEVIKLGSVAGYRIKEQPIWQGGPAGHLNFGSALFCISDLDRFERHLAETKYDCIHINFGLNDIFRGRNGRWYNPPEQYAEHLDKIITLLKTNGAKIIWANTTPIPDNDPDRPAGDDLIYNAAAEKVMNKHGIPINDLHGIITRWDGYAEWKKGSDVHFGGPVYAMLAKQVADKIAGELANPNDRK
ncbi:MAG: SGNH/GDSL hydrolase family protein [Verrucomicrobia bacterium]|nr:SGNH/GDSL hydrolase family protein [Verrucomicrobiota bacterium]